MPTLDPRTTALVLIDLQQGIVSMETAPHTAAQVVAGAKDLAARFREVGAPVVLVHVGWRSDGADRPSQNVDRPSIGASRDEPPPAFSEFAPGLRHDSDIVVIKRHWGAFTGTDLDLQLRRRGVRTIVLAGIATNMGVESTARSGWELSYDMMIVEDLCSSRAADMHAFAFEKIFPAIARVVRAEDVDFERG